MQTFKDYYLKIVQKENKKHYTKITSIDKFLNEMGTQNKGLGIQDVQDTQISNC